MHLDYKTFLKAIFLREPASTNALFGAFVLKYLEYLMKNNGLTQLPQSEQSKLLPSYLEKYFPKPIFQSRSDRSVIPPEPEPYLIIMTKPPEPHLYNITDLRSNDIVMNYPNIADYDNNLITDNIL
ncbi:hypothetical protein [Candidatus Nitrosocosmicus hydrocola]|uniref:hypothetical protein n=1 Tax=Candidatus Nitrosocosmicus hydrocola TaxID=1826872 RepID=UPI0011E5A653|nr:hypothetical protein [Candidatus Nitrosocosmicus hydrocola]